MNFFESPFIIPLGGLLVGIVAIVAGVAGKVQKERIQADERMAMIARGMSIDDIERVLNTRPTFGIRGTQGDPLPTRARVRLTGIILCSVGVGLMLLGVALELILQVREVLACSAVGLIPLMIGIGFFIDYSLQKREMERLGLEPPRQV